MTGNIIVISSPSGGGKTSLINKTINHIEKIKVSVSYTTRSIRPGEVEGKDYFFINKKKFFDMVHQNMFIEYASVFDHYYGTSIQQVSNVIQSDIDIILDIDWQGAEIIKKKFPDSIFIFIIPPSIDILKQRLIYRKQDTEYVINNRMHFAKSELCHYSKFDYLIINDNFDKAVVNLNSIIIANRLKMKKQILKNKQLISSLL